MFVRTFASFLITGFLSLQMATACPADATRVVAVVGEQLISEGDLLHKQNMQRCIEDSNATIEQCAVMLINDALERDVLHAAYGAEPPASALNEKAKWIDKNTRDPAKLRCMKHVFGTDSLDYHRLFVSPTLVNPKLHSLYALDRTTHAHQRDSIERLWAIVKKNPKAITTLPHDTVTIQSSLKAESVAGMPAAGSLPLVDNVLSHLSSGAIWKSIVEDDFSYSIVRLDSKSGTAYHTTMIRVSKRPFDDWFRQYAKAHSPVNFIDANLEREVRKQYATLWWMR